MEPLSPLSPLPNSASHCGDESKEEEDDEDEEDIFERAEEGEESFKKESIDTNSVDLPSSASPLKEEEHDEVLPELQSPVEVKPVEIISRGGDQPQKSPDYNSSDIESTLRWLLGLADAQIFDVHMIFQILKKKYNKNYC